MSAALGGALVVAPHHKGFPAAAVGRRVEELHGLGLPAGGFQTPVLLCSRARLDANVAAMQRFCDDAGMLLAPHVKTTMSPEVIARQLAAGAWAATVATPAQARAVAALGAERILLANEVSDPAALAWIAGLGEGDPELLCYVDSHTGLRLLEAARRGSGRTLQVLVELGCDGGRTGARTLEELRGLAEAVASADGLTLRGVAGFEGTVGRGRDAARLDAVRAYLERLRAAALAVAGRCERPLVSAGGSAFFEQVRELLAPLASDGTAQVVLRSGCYVTHDSGAYAGYLELTAGPPGHPPLEAALELWSRVLSAPEPGLAILDCGKRDTALDAGPPLPLHVLRAGAEEVAPLADAEIAALDDQHAYLRHPPELELGVGDLVGLGVSHPCTTLDKWRLIPLVDSERRLCGALSTLF
jgi:D-serine deaminase-like pyridoxal phosphate-dependent protein